MQKLDYVKCVENGKVVNRTTKKNGILAQKMPRRACRILSRSICHLYLTTTTHVSLPPAVEAVAQNGGQDGDDSVGLTQQQTHTYYHAWV